MRNEASEAQVQAAEPGRSTWLSANAGSGKTRVLIDRVARLLLGKTPPQRILCLTYTNAAASEMQNRLFRRLGEWAMMPEAELAAALAEMGAEAADLAEARRLFARAIETPGGLRIQTIHSFCASLLRRFPLEAQVAPQFTEIDARSQSQLMREILEDMASGEAAGTIAALAGAFGEHDFFRVIGRLAELRRRLKPRPREAILAAMGLPADANAQDLAQGALRGVGNAWRDAAVARLNTSSSNDRKLADTLAAVDFANPTPSAQEVLESALLAKTGQAAGEPKPLPTKALREADPALFEPLSALAQRIATLRPQRLALKAADQAAVLSNFAAAFLPRLAEAKSHRGWLDFDDLIEKAERLLTDPAVAAWVLFRLDGGIDHILVDEAQDTSPDQWRVIELLTQEFTAGLGARERPRTLFVVGDKKQSIYSFQGADITGFDARNQQFRQAFEAVGLGFANRELRHSFRSSPVILSLVDQLFGDRHPEALGPDVRHAAFHASLPGRVECWPVIEKEEAETEEDDWTEPVDRISPRAPQVVLAESLAERIRQMLEAGTPVPSAQGGSRPARPGDVLILVRRRSGVFPHLIRACKQADLPVAGADRIELSEELAVRDLLALLTVLATPEDDLSLAALLRSPLCGWSEADLFRLAHGRPGYLWEALRSTETPAATPARAMITDLRDQADFLRPHDLLERALIRHRGRIRLVTRLGEEVEESIDALLAQALAYEQAEVPSLDGFLAWMQGEDSTIKRQTGEAADRIRIMTVHGAKGLEGEIVILPDTGDRSRRSERDLLVDETGLAFVSTAKESAAPPVSALMEARQPQGRRGIAAALICGADPREDPVDRGRRWQRKAGKLARTGGRGDAGSWCGRRRRGPADPAKPRLAERPAATPNRQPKTAVSETIPGWMQTPFTPPQMRSRPLSPSALGGAKVLPGSGTGEADATIRGAYLHLLLQHLPGRSEARWPMLAQALVPDPALRDEMVGTARRLISDPALAEVFVPGALTEAAIAGTLFGQPAEGSIDRLVVTPDRLLAVDFKSNRLVPAEPQDCPEAILRQMGAYAVLLEQAFPGRKVETAVLWTETGQLMPLGSNIVREALARATSDGGLPLDAGPTPT